MRPAQEPSGWVPPTPCVRIRAPIAGSIFTATCGSARSSSANSAPDNTNRDMDVSAVTVAVRGPPPNCEFAEESPLPNLRDRIPADADPRLAVEHDEKLQAWP